MDKHNGGWLTSKPSTLQSMHSVWTKENTGQQIQTDRQNVCQKTHSYPSNDFVFQVRDVLS